MRAMNHSDLGQIAMLQTIVVVVGFLQLGMINGGYRLYAGADSALSHRINNTVMTCFLTLASALLPALLFLQYLFKVEISNIETETLLMGFIIGFATLASTWVNNTLIAKGRLGVSSAVNFTAATLSLGFVLIPDTLELHQAFIAFLIQPLSVLVLALIIHQPSRPRSSLDGGLIKEIVVLGFAPFCAGVVTLANFQIDRWFIITELGSESMGFYYLTIVYSTVFILIPVSMMNLFYPRTIKAYEARNKAIFFNLKKQHLNLLIAYVVLTIIITFCLLETIIESYLPSYLGFENLVFLSLPGLIALALFDNIALVLQAAKKMFNILVFSLSCLLLNTLLLIYLVNADKLSLETASLAKSTSYVLAYLLVLSDLRLKKKSIINFNT